MQEELILIDQLEDQLIDHPDAKTRRELNASTLDETFQKKLNERADEISQIDEADTGDATKGGLNFQFLVTLTHLDYTYKDYGDLQQEIAEWFTLADLELLGGLKNLAQEYFEAVQRFETDKGTDDMEISYIRHCLDELSNWLRLDSNNQAHHHLNALIYYSFGDYANCSSAQEQVYNIRERSKILFSLKSHEAVVRIVKQIIDDELNERKCLPDEAFYFKLLTLLYFMVNLFTQMNDSPQYIELRDYLGETDILSDLVSFLEYWKLNPNTHLRARNIIQLVWKLIIVEFGDSLHIKSCDSFLVDLHNIQNKVTDSKNKLTCSPLDYFTFREDLVDKYPLFLKRQELYDFKELAKTLEENDASSVRSSTSSIEDDYKFFMAVNSESNSLSNFIANPRPNKAHSVLSQLPTQTVHIATPVPSPSSSPSDYMTGGEKIRKLYQVNQGIPFIYPQTDEFEVPYAIQEANEILQNCIYDSYSNKRLWQERQKFMIQERGFVNEYQNDADGINEFEYDEQILLKEHPQKSMEIKSIMRVERFYKTNLGKLNTFIEVLVEAINANNIDENLCFTERELRNENSFFSHDESVDASKKKDVDKVLLLQLAVLRAKEITAKASSAIIVLLLKWFKINHIVKYYFLTTILFDQQFFNIATEFLASSFNNSNIQDFNRDKDGDFERILYQNRLMNPKICIPQFDFFNNCLNKMPKQQKIQLINRTKINQLPSKIDADKRKCITIEQYNDDFFFILVNLMTIMNKIIIKNHTQRILTLNELKPSELFKMLATNYTNEYLNKPIFKILKKLIPYQGRKWKSVNMDLISMIYLNCRLSLRDNWLSGKDLESDFNNSFDQEISLRGLIQFYNMRKYPKSMELLGYQVSTETSNYPIDDDFDYI